MAGPKSRRSSGASTPAKAPLAIDRVLEAAAPGSPTPVSFVTPTKELAKEATVDVPAVNCTVVSVDERDDASGSRLWMSDEAMVAVGITTKSFIAVSVRESDSSSALTPLTELCAAHFNVVLPCAMKTHSPGVFHAVAEVWPSRKLLRYGVRLSKHLATSLGHPTLGSSVLLNPIILAQSGKSKTTSVASMYATKAEISACTHLSLQWCPPLENITAPPPAPSPVFKTPLSSSKRMARTSSAVSPFQEPTTKEPPFRHSPSPSPAGKMDAKRLEGSPGITNYEEARSRTPTVGNIAAVRALLEKEGGKGAASAQLIVEKLLCGRYLLPGSFVLLSLCACDCLFLVSQAKSSSGTEELEESCDLGALPPPPLFIYKVSHNTKITVSGPHVGDPKTPPPRQTAEIPNSDGSIGKVEEAVRYTALGGLEAQIAEIKQIVHFSLLRPDLLAGYGLPPHRGILLYGPPGTGKSSLARAAACEAGVPLFAINGPDVVSQFYGESEGGLRAVFTAAEEAAPSVVVIDEVDAIAPERKDGSEELAQRMVGALLKLMDEGGNKRVLVIAATNRPDALDPALRRPGRFDKEIEIGVPTSKGRHEILQHFLGKLRHNLQYPEILELAAGTHGFVGADLSSLCHEAALAALRRSIQSKQKPPPSSSPLSPSAGFRAESVMSSGLDNGHADVSGVNATQSCAAEGEKVDAAGNAMGFLCRALETVQLDHGGAQGAGNAEADGHRALKVILEDFEVAKTRVRPSAMREVMLEVPKVRWADIGGLEDVKQQLQEAVIWPQQHGDRLTSIGAQPIRGVLLYGPPGCSKTLLARACASEAGLNFIAVKGPELFSKWVGESEKAVQALFARARVAAPSIVFFDEIDGLAVARSSGHADSLSVGDRVMSQLLTEMDGLKPSTGVSVIAATNRPDIIDSALLRPGRFDRQLYVGPPSEVAREKIFQIQLRNTPCSPHVSCAALAAQTPAYTGADISAVCREAAMAALEEDLHAERVELRHFDIALAGVAPSNPGPNAEFFTKFNRGLFT